MTLNAINSFKLRHYAWLAYIAAALSILATAADRGASNVILPDIGEYFQADLPTIQWVQITYLVVVTSLMLPMGRMADIIGKKRTVILGLIIFVIGDILCSASFSLMMMFISRSIQGLGAAMIQGIAMAIVVDAFGEGNRGKAVGLTLIFVGIGNVTGPAIGGGVSALFGWRAVFLTTAALAGISALLAWLVLTSNKQTDSHEQFDWFGAFFCVGFLVAVLVGFTLVPEVGWLSIYTLPALMISGFFLFGFVKRSSQVAYPVLDVRLFLKPLFSFSIASNLFCFLGMSSIWFLLPFYLKYIVKYPPEQIGLIFIPAAISMATLSPLSGKFSDILGWRRFTVGGLLFCSCGLLILSTLNEDTPRWIPLIGVIPVSGGMGAFYGPNNSATLSVTNNQNYGAVISFINLVRNGGNLLSIPISTLVVTSVMGSLGQEPDLTIVTYSNDSAVFSAFLSGMQSTFRILCALTIIAMILSIYKGNERQDPVRDTMSKAVK